MANKRIRSPRSKNSPDLLEGLENSAPRKRRTLQKRARSVENEIHRLECMIAAAPQISAGQQLRRRNYVPPADEIRDTRRPARKGRVPLQQQRTLQRRRTFQLVQFGVLLLAIAAIAGWMKQWLQF